MRDLANHVVPRWASKWRNLGMQLKIDYHLMDNIQQDFPSDCEMCCNKMLAEWLQSNSAACWEDLIVAVDNLLSYGKNFIYLFITHYTKVCCYNSCMHNVCCY